MPGYISSCEFLKLGLSPHVNLFFSLLAAILNLPSSLSFENMLLPLSTYSPTKVTSQVFYGSKTHTDHFHSLHIFDKYMLVGARNAIFNVSLHSLHETQKINWLPESADVKLCLLRQKAEEDCQNYIRVIALLKNGDLMACGTHAYRPMCRTYRTSTNNKKKTIVETDNGVARSPYHFSHNSTSLFINGRLYTATVGDSSGRAALIYSKPLRTEQYDSQLLNEPQFVSSFMHEQHAYFLFRETAVENINCGKAIFSRVGRVCLNDPGGELVLRNSWTTFSKVRLNCSIPGDFPFYFDEIQAASDLGEGSVYSTILSHERSTIIYAIFSTPTNSLRGSAVCAFKMSDIEKSFEGPYKEQKTSQSNWLPVKNPPSPHPASTCPSNTQFFSDQTLNFIKSHPLMDKAIPSTPNKPLIIQTGFSYSLVSIAVDWQVKANDHRHYDVIYLATDDGQVIKTFNRGRDKKVDMVTIEVLVVFRSRSPIREMRIYQRPESNEKRLLVVTAEEIRSISLQRCHNKTTCRDCVAMRDPYCSWTTDKCTTANTGLQNLETGLHPLCKIQRSEDQKEIVSFQQEANSTTTSCQIIEPCNCNDQEVIKKTEIELTKSEHVKNDFEVELESFLNSDTEENEVPQMKSVHGSVCQECPESLNSAYYIILPFIVMLCIVFLVGFAAGYHYVRHHCTKKEDFNVSASALANSVQNNHYEKMHALVNYEIQTLAVSGEHTNNCFKEKRSSSFSCGDSDFSTMPPTYNSLVEIYK